MGDTMKPWYKKTHIWGQVNLTEDDPERCNLDFWKDYWKQSGVEGIIINCGGIVSYYQSKFTYQYKAATLGDKDYFGKWNKAAREAGLAVIARMDINCTTKDMYDEFPQWYCRDIEGNPILTQGRYTTCVNGGYYQKFIPQVFQEIIEKYHPDGFADNSWAGPGDRTICYCQNCQNKYWEKYHSKLPHKVDWNDSNYRQWIRWNYDIRLDNWNYFNKVTQEYGGSNCLWFGMINGNPFQTGGRFYDIRRLIENAKFIFSDHQSRDRNSGFEQNLISGNLLHMVSDENIIIAESMAHYYKGMKTFRLSSGETQEIRKWLLCGISGGISPWYHFVGGRVLDSRKLTASTDVFRWHKEVRHYLTERKNIANVGVVWNQETSIYYGRDDALEKSALSWYGITQALSQAGIPFAPIHADDIDKYDDRLHTLILPNIAIMTDEQMYMVEQWIKRGKNLVITGETGCFDQDGEWKGSHSLYSKMGLTILPNKHGVIGKNIDNWLEYDNHNYMRIQAREHPIYNLLKGAEILPLGGTVQKTISTGCLKTMGTYIPAFPIYPPEFSWIREESEEAVIYGGTLESGSRVVYMAADIERCYGKYQLPDHQRLLEGIISWCANNDFPVRVESSAHVSCNIYEKEDCYVLHLVNLAGCNVPVGTLRESLPIGPVIVKLGDDIKVSQVYGAYGQEEYKLLDKENSKEVMLPLLEEQELLILKKQ